MTTWVSHHWRLAVAWALSLLITGALTATATDDVQRAPLGVPDGMITEAPTVVTGPDIGFRLERTQNDVAIGKLVVRVDGRWIETGSAPMLVPARK
jgi:hypothetical protein